LDGDEAEDDRGDRRQARRRQRAQVECRRRGEEDVGGGEGGDGPGGPEAEAERHRPAERRHRVGGAHRVLPAEEDRGDDEDAEVERRGAAGGGEPSFDEVDDRDPHWLTKTTKRSQRLFPVGPVVTRSPAAASAVPASKRARASSRGTPARAAVPAST